MKKLNEDIGRQKDLMNIVNLSDLNNAGTWSPDKLARKKEGREIYTIDNGKFTKRAKEPEERGPKSAWGANYKKKEIYYLTQTEAESVNLMLEMAKEHEAKANQLRNQIKMIVGDFKR